MYGSPTSACANSSSQNQTAPEISHLPSQQPSEIIRNGATFSTEPITAWQGALRIKGNAYETKIQKPPRINLRCATENYPQLISNTGSHMQYRSGGVAVKGSVLGGAERRF